MMEQKKNPNEKTNPSEERMSVDKTVTLTLSKSDAEFLWWSLSCYKANKEFELGKYLKDFKDDEFVDFSYQQIKDIDRLISFILSKMFE